MQAKLFLFSGTILHLRLRHIASPVTILHLRVRHIASPVTILHLRLRHIASPVTILHLRVRHIASPDTILHLRVRYITSPGTTYCTPHTRYYIFGYEITYEIRHNTAHGILQFCPQSPSIVSRLIEWQHCPLGRVQVNRLSCTTSLFHSVRQLTPDNFSRQGESAGAKCVNKYIHTCTYIYCIHTYWSKDDSIYNE